MHFQHAMLPMWLDSRYHNHHSEPSCSPHAHPLSSPRQQLFMIHRAMVSTSGDDEAHCGARSQCNFRYACSLTVPLGLPVAGYGKTFLQTNVGIWGGRCIPTLSRVRTPPPLQDSSATHAQRHYAFY